MTAKNSAAAKRELQNARKALAARRDKRETEAFRKANRRVLAAEKNVPWWRR